MRYRSKDCLRDFEFHDSEWSLASHDASSFVFNARALNSHQSAPQNAEDCDMEILGYRSFATETPMDHTGEQCLMLFLREANHGMWVKSFNQIDHDRWMNASCGDNEPYYEVTLSFDEVVIEWDAFRCPAWYVLRSRGVEA